MDITFNPLQTDHLPLLFKWLEKPHVQIWWDPGVDLTPESLEEKYGSYPDGYYVEDGIKKPLRAFIVEVDHEPVAYVQLYNVQNYPGANNITELKFLVNCAGLDIFIGDEKHVSKGIGTAILRQFLIEFVDPKFEACLVDPDKNNIQAIRAYEKVGFRAMKPHGNLILMMRVKNEL